MGSNTLKEEMINVSGNSYIISKVVDILKTSTCINPTLIVPETYDTPLTGKYFGLFARDMVYLYFALEDSFGITFDEDGLTSGAFNTINGISMLIAKKA